MILFISLVIIGIITAIILSLFGEKIPINLQWIIGIIWMIAGLVYCFGLAVHLITF